MKAELLDLPDRTLASRIYQRWKTVMAVEASDAVKTSLNGDFDYVVETDDEARTLVAALKPALISGLAFGPMPEPRCTCCHVLNRVELWNNTAVMALLDWHDTPFRENKRRWKGGPEVYRRCLVIYDAAKGITDAEVHRDDQVQPGS